MCVLKFNFFLIILIQNFSSDKDDNRRKRSTFNRILKSSAPLISLKHIKFLFKNTPVPRASISCSKHHNIDQCIYVLHACNLIIQIYHTLKGYLFLRLYLDLFWFISFYKILIIEKIYVITQPLFYDIFLPSLQLVVFPQIIISSHIILYHNLICHFC